MVLCAEGSELQQPWTVTSVSRQVHLCDKDSALFSRHL